MQENDEYSCCDCIYKGSEACEMCITIHSPSGNISRPTLYQTASGALSRVPPRSLHDARRAKELGFAIIQCTANGCIIPSEWVSEFNELMIKRKPKSRQ